MRNICYLLLFCFLGFCRVHSQELDISKLTESSIDSMSDAELDNLWKEAQKQGYTLQDLERIAELKKIPQPKIKKIKERFQQKSSLKNKQTIAEFSKKNNPHFGIVQQDSIKQDLIESPVFGYNFFRNPNISFTPSLNMPTPANYIIGTGDELLIEIWGASENSTTQIVDNQGFISLEMAGKVRVSELTFAQAKERINSALKQIYSGISAPEGSPSKIHTSVSISNVRSVKVNIIGEVTAPGTYSLSALSTIINALYASGGPTEKGTFRNVQLIRAGKLTAEFDVYDYLLTGSQKGNITLNDQDVILIAPYQNQIEVKGAVKREGIYEIKKGETLADLIRYFGGFTSNAYKDNLIIERITGAKREIKEIPHNQKDTFVMEAGDKLMVHELTDIYHNKLSITGAVYQPGNYAYSEGMTLQNLIEKAAGVLNNAFLDRAILFRTNYGVEKETINFSVEQVLNKKQNIALQQNDSIHIFSKNEIDQQYTLRIEGGVKNPQNIPFMKGIKVEDLIVIAGGFVEGADPSTIQVSRQVNDEFFNKISEVYDVSLSPDLKISANSIELMPNDIVTVRLKKGYTKQQMVKIEGEVRFPGYYTIQTKEDRVTDLIQRAGGFSPYAYIKGASLIRKKTDIGDSKQVKQVKEVNSKVVDSVSIKEKDEYIVGIDLQKALKKYDSYQNLFLKEGDVLTIPSEKQTIEIKGSVLSPSMVRYQEGKSLRYYINNAGGFSTRSQKRSVYVVYANGEVKSTRNYLLFKDYPKIEPGAIIIVPEKPERKGLSATEAVSITTALTTLAILLFNTFKK